MICNLLLHKIGDDFEDVDASTLNERDIGSVVIENVVKKYRTKGMNYKNAVDGLSLDLHAGHVLALLG